MLERPVRTTRDVPPARYADPLSPRRQNFHRTSPLHRPLTQPLPVVNSAQEPNYVTLSQPPASSFTYVEAQFPVLPRKGDQGHKVS